MAASSFKEVLDNFYKNEEAKLIQKAPQLTGIEEFIKQVEFVKTLMRTDNSIRGPRVPMSEALQSPDASIIFPKVISDVLVRPLEPLMIGQTVLAKTIQIDNIRSIEIPAMGALRAFDIPETGTYTEQYPSFTENVTEIKVTKSGLMVSISQEVIDDSQWDLLALYTEAAGYAMGRHKEEKIFNGFTEFGHAVYDNSIEDSAAWTSGRNYAQKLNFSMTFDNMINMMGVVVAHGYVPTHIITHPMAWSVFMTDPMLRTLSMNGGGVGASLFKQIPSFDQQVNIPWAVTYLVTPFVPFTRSTVLATSQASGLTACDVTDIYVVDSNNSCVILQRTPMGVEDFNDPYRDITRMKVSERYGIGIPNAGKAIAVAKNVRIEQNWAPVQAVLAATPA